MGVDNPDKLIDGLNSLLPSKKVPTVSDKDMKAFLQSAGVPVKKTKPFGNDPCPCGSGNRYDMCCSENKLE